MRVISTSKLLKLFIISGTCLGALYAFVGRSPNQEATVVENRKIQDQLELRTQISATIGESIRHNELPEAITMQWDGEEKSLKPTYTIDPTLQKEADRLLKAYRPDYGAIFMIDASTGEVLVMSSYQKESPAGQNLNLQASFPAASIFKVVTATTAVDKAGILPSDKIHYNGGAYTLYKKNVLSDKVTRWTNVITLRDAFARSINTAFGRLSIENINPEDLYEYAGRFMFNQEIPTDFPVEMGVAYVPPEKGYALAEAASGFNRTNRMSPVQGAMIAASIANDGHIVVPYLVRSLTSSNGQEVYAGSALSNGEVMTKESAEKVRTLMEQTLVAGTSRRSFRPILKDRKFSEVEMGGKTGHLTGDNPKGRVDWFVGYALDGERRVAVAALTVNVKYWTVKSSHLGQTMFRKYFGPLVTRSKEHQVVTSNQ